MKKYVDVEALTKELESKRLVFDDPVNFKEAQIRAEALRKQGKVIRETIENFPAADVVEVVRCKSCTYRYTQYCNAKHERADMDFCSHGRRKEESKDQENKPFNALYNAFVERSKR